MDIQYRKAIVRHFPAPTPPKPAQQQFAARSIRNRRDSPMPRTDRAHFLVAKRTAEH
jgi:hypothetical protein